MANATRAEIPALTGLRFLAVFYVVLFHSLSSYLGRMPMVARDLVRGAPLVLGVFFVLSGFVLTYNYQDSIRRGVREFWVSRIARIYPLYLLSLAAALPLFVYSLRALSPGDIVARVGTVALWDLPLLQAWNVRIACQWNCPTWTISSEMFYYALFPLLVAALAGRATRTLVAISAASLVGAAVLVELLVRFVVPGIGATTVSPRALVLYFPPTHLAEFVVGVAAALWVTRTDQRGSGRLLVPAAVAVSFVVLAAGTHDSHVTNVLVELSMAPVYAALVIGLTRGGGIVGAWLGARPMELLGRASFGLYVLHLPLFDYLRLAYDPDRGRSAGVGMGRVIAWLLASWVIAVALSLVTHRFVEEPARRAVRRFARRRRPMVIEPGAGATA